MGTIRNKEDTVKWSELKFHTLVYWKKGLDKQDWNQVSGEKPLLQPYGINMPV